MDESTIEYFMRRENEERLRAETGESFVARQAHLAMAKLYAERLRTGMTLSLVDGRRDA